MTKFAPPDVSTYYGEDLSVATQNYKSSKELTRFTDEGGRLDLDASEEVATAQTMGKVALLSNAYEQKRPVNQVSGGLESGYDTDGDILARLESLAKNEYGSIDLNPDQVESLRTVLESFGILSSEPTQDEIDSHVETARRRVSDGTADGFLNGLRRSKSLQEVKGWRKEVPAFNLTWGKEPILYVDTNMIEGVSAFDNWNGTFSDGRPNRRTHVRTGGGASRYGIETDSVVVIKDFAVEPTKIPPLDYLALDIVIDDEGARLFSRDSHRVAAAKLRGDEKIGSEPIGFSSCILHDARTPASKVS